MQFLFEDHVLDIDRRELRRGAQQIAVGPQVFDLLVYLVQNRERVVTKDDLLDAVWSGRFVSESNLTTRINAARKAIGDTGEEQRLIRTVPRKGFRFVGVVTCEAENVKDVRGSAATTPKPLPLPDKPSIAVLPFDNMSGDREQEYLADGMVEEIITALSRFRQLFVIARNSTFTYKGHAVDVNGFIQSMLGSPPVASRTCFISFNISRRRRPFNGRRIRCKIKTGYRPSRYPYIMNAQLLQMPTMRSGIIVFM